MRAVRLHRPNVGFTMVEMIVVIVLMGVLAVGTTRYITTVADGYALAARASALAGSGRIAIERLARELRNALPNSVRLSGQCLEFIPVVAASRYLDVPDADGANAALDFPVAGGGPASNAFTILIPDESLAGSAFVAVNPVTTADVYSTASGSAMNTFSAVQANGSSTSIQNVLMTDVHRYSSDSPTHRVYFAGTPLSYCVVGDQLRRYAGYGLNATQQQPALASSMVIAAGLSNAASVFSYTPGSPQRAGMVNILFELSAGNQTLTLNHEVHIRNVP